MNLHSRDSIITFSVIAVVLVLAGAFLVYLWHADMVTGLRDSPAGHSLGSGEGKAVYTDMSGQTINLENDLGNVLVMISWASWCPFCKNELTNLSRIGDDYRGRGVRVIAINRAEQKETAERFLKQVDVTNSLSLVLDPTDHYYHSIEGYAMPETVVYGRNGEILKHFRGEVQIEELKQVLDSITAEGEAP